MENVVGKNIREVSGEEIDRFWTKSYDEGVRPSIEYPEIPLYELLENSASKYPENVALDFIGKAIKYRELDDIANRVASFLYENGYEKSRVILGCPNTPHYVATYYGILKAGSIVVQCNPMYTERELRHIAENSESKIMFAFEPMFPRLKALLDEGLLVDVVICKIEDYLKFPLNFLYSLKKQKVSIDRKVMYWKDVMKYPPTDKRVNVNPKEDVAVFQYTGGTTGLPKAVMLTHFNLVANIYQLMEWLPEVNENDVIMGALPYFHSYGMTTSMNLPIAVGAKIVLIPDPRDLKRVLESIQKHRVTLYCGVPTMYNAINNYPEVNKYDLSSIRACVSGAAPLPLEVKRKFEELTGGKLVEGYGLSETSPVTHANPINGVNKEGSIGLPIPDTIAVVVDSEGNILPIGETGELAIKGPQVMKGYYKMEEETKNTLINGWLLTGDIAKIDEDGYFYIVDRKKDMIIAGGYNIYPREVEEVLYEHPDIVEAAVIGVPDPKRGETVKAFVVLREGANVTAEDIEKFCRQHLAAYKVPRIIEFKKELPKSNVGKVLRRVLKEEEMKKKD
ncbi:Acyl-CoA synthetases (AMP-forming)/AMP-acid ligases II [Archaeoglobus sulfaticallidus PM70-1]|uniref:Acyl-CoA synthetases (AMP-forming)/AMP-acid ligases II n=1 Tax=Archaeoglobus sulfaticallidus PM70-1 TaxID=387631 RepID=N0BE51_9EURY|nr:long-chain fatty acid--CoA ligase [Archaeoglobus sulfaticallidus]AGK61904.1 Acyl-CoA synthetases (AMP-forming)/AMP-acid ligases II [Archaeoglobus sulfaticallidus PM70-1]